MENLIPPLGYRRRYPAPSARRQDASLYPFRKMKMERITAQSTDELLGKLVLVGVTYLDDNDNVESTTEIFGVVLPSNDDEIRIRREIGDDFTLPPDHSAFAHASPGIYTLNSTGEKVENPDYISQWTVRSPTAE